MQQIRNGFVLGAGLGTRLKALTQQRPKPLVPVVNKPLITYAFDHLLEAGIQRLVVNTHHRFEAYAEVFPDGSYRHVPVEFRHEHPVVLETAGGIKNVEDLLRDQPFIVYNGDILTDLPIEPAIRAHFDRGDEVTMILRSKDGPLQVACELESGRIIDIGKRLHAESAADFLFTGVYLINPEFFARIPPATKISVIPIFLEMIKAGARIGGIVIDDGHWWDLGTREQYLAVHTHLRTLATSEQHAWIDPSAKIAGTAQLTGATAIGAGTHIGEHASLHDCIVWEGAEIAAGTLLNQCIVTAGARVDGIHSHADL